MASKCFKTLSSTLFIFIMLLSQVSSHDVSCPPGAPPLESAPKPQAKCPKDTLKFGVCGSWLGGLVTEIIGTKPSAECCTVLKGLADLEAALCLCTAIKANVLGIVKIKIPIAASLLVNGCGKKVPEGFVCP